MPMSVLYLFSFFCKPPPHPTHPHPTHFFFFAGYPKIATTTIHVEIIDRLQNAICAAAACVLKVAVAKVLEALDLA